MALKRKSSTFEPDLSELESGANFTQSGEGAGLLGSQVPATTTSAHASKRRKTATPITPAFSSPTAKKRGRSLGKRSSLTPSVSGSRASTPARQTSAQALPRSRVSSTLNKGPSEELFSVDNIISRSASAAIDDTALDYSTQGIGLQSYKAYAAPQNVSTTPATSAWQAKHDNVTVPPAYTRDLHSHAELVLGLTDEINLLEKRAEVAEASQKASHHSNKKLIRENAALKKGRVQLLDWLRENAADVQLPAELVNIDLTPTTPPNTATATYRHLLGDSPHFPGPGLITSPIVDIAQDEGQPTSSSTITAPLSRTRATDTESHAQYQLHAMQNLSPRELQPEHAQLKVQFQQTNSNIAAPTNEIAVLKNTKARKAISNTQLDAEVESLYKRIDKLKDTQATFADAIYEYARLERYLTAMCVKYENFVRHLEENMNMQGAVAAAKRWIAAQKESDETQLADEGIFSAGARRAPLDWRREAACRDSGNTTTSGDIDPCLSSADSRNNSFATQDSGFAEGKNIAPPPSAATPVNSVGGQGHLPQYGYQNMLLPPAAPFPVATHDGNASSPESIMNASGNHGAAIFPPASEAVIFEDSEALRSTSSIQDFTGENANFGPALTTLPNAGNYHGDGGNILAGIGESFDNYPTSTPHININGPACQNQYSMNTATYDMASSETNIMPNMTGPPFDIVSPSAYYRPNSELQPTSNTASDSGTAITNPSGYNTMTPAMSDPFNDSIATFNKENTQNIQNTQISENPTFYPPPPDVDALHCGDDVGVSSFPLP